MAVEIRVLGRVDALVDGRSLPLGGSKQRAVLAMLALRANRTVGADELIDGLWGERPPAERRQERPALRLAAAKGIGLRRLRGADRHPRPGLRAPAPGGRGGRGALRAPRRASAARGRAGDRRRRGHRARSSCGRAPRSRTSPRSRSREPRSAGSRSFTCARSSSRSTPSSRRDDHGEAIGSLEALIAEHPAHERFHAQRMLALYRAGRQSEAVEGYRAAHRTLSRADRGRSPGPSCAASRSRSSRQDPALDARPPPRSCRASSRADRRFSPVATASCGGCESAGPRPRRVGPGSRSSPVPRGSARPGSPPSSPPRSNPRAAVLYAAGSGAPDAALEAIRGAEESELPTLLVLDDADDASPALLESAAALAAKPRDTPLLLLVLHRDDEGPPAFADAAQRLALRPLRVEAAAEIAELYAPADGVAMPLETLMADSEGVPLRVHRAASGWAQAQAAERLEADVGSDGHRRAATCGPPRPRWREASPTSSSPASGPASTWSTSRSIPRRPRCARSAASRPSTRPTPSTSSAASGSSPTWWRAWSAPP